MPLNYLMDEKFRNLPLRNGVGIVVLNQQNKIFVAKRIDNPKDFWQMPQGGVDDGEKPIDAAYRELEEETGMKNLEFIKEIEGTTMYELPEHLLGIIWKGKYKGQRQKWFLMRYLGKDNDINIKTDNPEFLDWKWIDLNEITEVVVDFKLHVYKELKEKIQKIIWKIWDPRWAHGASPWAGPMGPPKVFAASRARARPGLVWKKHFLLEHLIRKNNCGTSVRSF